MKHETDKEASLTIDDTDESFEAWADRDYISDDLSNRLKSADVLIVPREGFRDVGGPVFPVKTAELFSHLDQNLPDDIEVEICIEDEDYREVALHHELVEIGTIFLTDVSLPIVINLLSDYIKMKWGSLFEDRGVRVILEVEDDSKSKSFTYEGKPEHFSDISEQVMEEWKEDERSN